MKKREEIRKNVEKYLAGQISLCISCGTCRKSCTVLPFFPSEISVARGKIALLKSYADGKIKVSKELRNIFELCTSCGLCTEDCPAHVDPDALLTLSRGFLFKGNFFERLISMHLGSKTGLNVLRLFLQMITFFLPSIKSNSTSGKIWKKIPSFVPQMGKRFIPSIDEKIPQNFLGKISGKGEGLKIFFYPGCFSEFFFKDQIISSIELLREIAEEILFPENLPCCGLPSLELGCAEHAFYQAQKIVEITRDFNPHFVVTICGSCGFSLKKIYPLLSSTFMSFSRKVKDISEVMLEFKKNLKFKNFNKQIKVTYHHCCHLRNGMGVKDEPVEILKIHPFVNYIPLEEPQKCCGFGGTMFFRHPELSRSIVEDKIKDIAGVNPEIVLTECPGCLINIQGALLEKELPISCLGFVQLFA